MNKHTILTSILFVICLALTLPMFGQAKKTGKKGSAQTDPTLISEDKLPEAVLKSFKKRYSTAINPQWHHSETDTTYVVNCEVRNAATEIIFGQSGWFVASSEEVAPDKLLSACYKTLDMYCEKYKTISAYKITRADKENHFLVNVLQQKDTKSQKITKVYLDKSGRLIRIEEPDNSSNEEDEENAVLSKEEKKMNKAYEQDRRMDIYPVKISSGELPGSIQRWVDKNYPDYVYKKIDYKEVEKFEKEGRIYEILVQRGGINQPYATIWFTRDGNFLKLEDKFKEEAKKEEPAPVEAPKPQVTEAIKQAFAEKYPTVASVEWQLSEDETWIGVYTDKYGKNFAEYSSQASWIRTRTQLDYTKVPGAVRTAAEASCPKCEIKAAYKVLDPDVTKPYYTIVLYNKKAKSSQEINLLQTGKPKE
ncbi:MAG: PepSY-like domain-containing protein [Bacteroidales bacterium]|nr:PepSY-like domain-containing protein [Bacteroidales bacterium]